jgi:hypothetical protein
MVKGYNNLKCISGTKVRIKTEKTNNRAKKKEIQASDKFFLSLHTMIFLKKGDRRVTGIALSSVPLSSLATSTVLPVKIMPVSLLPRKNVVRGIACCYEYAF